MGIVNFLSRDPNGEPWPESELDEKIVVTSIESFHKALDCLHSRLSDHDGLDRNEKVLDFSVNDQRVSKQNTSSNSCYGNQNGQKRTEHDLNESETRSRSTKRENCEKPEISLSQSCHSIQSVEKSKIIQRNLPIHTKNRIRECLKKNREMKTGETSNSGKGRKIVRIQERNSFETLTEEVTETTFQRTRTTQRTSNKSDSDNSDSDEMPQVEWRARNRYIQANTGNSGPSTSTVATAQPALVSFWELIGAERDDKPTQINDGVRRNLFNAVPKNTIGE